MEKIDLSPPPLQLFVLSATDLECYEGAQLTKRTDGAFKCEKPSLFCQSEDGSVLFVASEDLRKAVTFATATGKVMKAWDVEQPIVKAFVSPLGTYVLTWHYPPRSRPGEPEPTKEAWDNLVLWNASTGKVVWRQQLKNQPESHMWPSIQWTADERFAARMTTSNVHFYNGTDMTGKEEFNLVIKGLSQFSIVVGITKGKDGATSKHYRAATFVPEKKNTMSNVTVWKLPEQQPAEGSRVLPEQEVSKAFGRGQKVDFLWNAPTSALIIKAFSAVDRSGGSYYGTYDCFYLRMDGTIDVNLRPKREGTIHDVQWDVHGRRFVMVYGAQPASATVYNLKANPIAEFGAGSRNMAAFSPGGHLLTLGGFGSLKGAIEVWDNKQIKKVAIAESFAASTFQWAPDSRHFLTAVLMDRMKVDNVVRIFAYDGTVLKEINKGKPTLLASVAWRNSPKGVYEALPPSPRCYEKAEKAEKAIASNPVRQKYVPPGMRGGGGGSSAATATLNSLRDTGSAVVGRVSKTGGSSASSSLSKAAPQRQLLVGEVIDEEEEKREAKALKKAEYNRKKQRAKEEALEAQREAEVVRERELEEKYSNDSPADIEKRLKKLRKKMRQVEALKEKDRHILLPEQVAKMAEEPKLFRIIKGLENRLAELEKESK